MTVTLNIIELMTMKICDCFAFVDLLFFLSARKGCILDGLIFLANCIERRNCIELLS